LLSGITE